MRRLDLELVARHEPEAHLGANLADDPAVERHPGHRHEPYAGSPADDPQDPWHQVETRDHGHGTLDIIHADRLSSAPEDPTSATE